MMADIAVSPSENIDHCTVPIENCCASGPIVSLFSNVKGTLEMIIYKAINCSETLAINESKIYERFLF